MCSCIPAVLLFCLPTGPVYRPSLPIFVIFHVHGISRPRGRPGIPEIDSGYSHWGSAWDGPSPERACPPSRPSPPSPCFAEVQGTPFLAFRSIYETRFFSHNFFGCPSGFVESDTTASRNFQFHAVVVTNSTKPDGNGPALWSCLVPFNVFRCRIPAPIPADKRAVKF